MTAFGWDLASYGTENDTSTYTGLSKRGKKKTKKKRNTPLGVSRDTRQDFQAKMHLRATFNFLLRKWLLTSEFGGMPRYKNPYEPTCPTNATRKKGWKEELVSRAVNKRRVEKN